MACNVWEVFTVWPHCLQCTALYNPRQFHPSDCLSVHLSHAGTLSRRMKIGSRGFHSEVAKTLVFWYQQWFEGRRPLPPKICAQSDPPPSEKRRLRPISAYTGNVSAVIASKISSIILLRIGSRPCAFQRVTDEVHTLPLTPQMVAQKANLSFLWIKLKFSRIMSRTKFLCVEISSSEVLLEPSPYLTVYRCWR